MTNWDVGVGADRLVRVEGVDALEDSGGGRGEKSKEKDRKRWKTECGKREITWRRFVSQVGSGDARFTENRVSSLRYKLSRMN